MDIRQAFHNPKTWRRVHAALTVAWFAAVVPTLLVWSDSVLWVALMSCWANAAAHFSAWQGARAEEGEQSGG
ncbi:hypothetical protein [Pseudonocardia sp. D17]|uniref:hypothetical protein n=1 Tax=Pseudonocardia sp. D17 TaxID=882661 RepID=UPI002B3F4424|nr:hypothetical protein PSD17_56380 [Pseudonocardia sp. D17]